MIDLKARLHMYGCFLFEVCAGVSHWSAVHFSVVLTAIYRRINTIGSGMLVGVEGRRRKPSPYIHFDCSLPLHALLEADLQRSAEGLYGGQELPLGGLAIDADGANIEMAGV